MSAINCLRCQAPLDEDVESCTNCGERVTKFQRTYSTKLIDGKYQILERLGLGGMGEIFKVRHIHLNEERVIKVMRANIASDEQALQRFLAEARTSTMIKHRNLAMLYDFSTLEDGSYYMVWEFIDGINIQKWISQHGPMPARLAAEVAIQSLEGLDHLHQMGLIHRDVSPENIMLSQDYQGRLLAKVIDFGIAKQLSDGGSGQGLTQTGMFLGKLKYASPEQAGFLREGEHIDARSDIYSFGVVFYEMLTGRAPFLATNPQGYILKHATEKPLPPSQANPDLPIDPRLEALVLKALEKDREHRFLTAAEFAESLEKIIDELPEDERFAAAAPTLRGTGRVSTGPTRSPRVTTATAKARAPEPSEDEATVISGGSTGPSQMAPTLAGSTPTLAGAEPTLVDAPPSPRTVIEERDRAAQPTLVDVSAGAEPTEIDRDLVSLRPEKKSRTALYAAIAAALIIVIALAVVLSRQSSGPPISDTTTTTVTDEAPPPTLDEARILLNASPYGSLEKVVHADTGQPVDLGQGDLSTPLRLELPPGEYEFVMLGPEGKERQSVTVPLEAGKQVTKTVDFHRVDLDEISERILNR